LNCQAQYSVGRYTAWTCQKSLVTSDDLRSRPRPKKISCFQNWQRAQAQSHLDKNPPMCRRLTSEVPVRHGVSVMFSCFWFPYNRRYEFKLLDYTAFINH
jgi:hypothetical protein